MSRKSSCFYTIKVHECVGITITLILKKVRVCGPRQKNLLIGGLASILCLQGEGIVNFVSIKVHYLGDYDALFSVSFWEGFSSITLSKTREEPKSRA